MHSPIPNFSEIELSAAELLRFKYVQFWRRPPPWINLSGTPAAAYQTVYLIIEAQLDREAKRRECACIFVHGSIDKRCRLLHHQLS